MNPQAEYQVHFSAVTLEEKRGYYGQYTLMEYTGRNGAVYNQRAVLTRHTEMPYSDKHEAMAQAITSFERIYGELLRSIDLPFMEPRSKMNFAPRAEE